MIDLVTTQDYSRPMTISAQYAETTVADLLYAADKGEEVVIARPGKPALRLVQDEAFEPSKPRVVGRKHLFGAWEGLVTLPTDEEWKAMDKEIEDDMLNGPIFPPGHA